MSIPAGLRLGASNEDDEVPTPDKLADAVERRLRGDDQHVIVTDDGGTGWPHR